MTRRAIAILLFVLGGASIAVAQPQDQSPEEPALNRPSLGWGFSSYPAGAWTSIAASVANPTDRPVDLLVVSWFTDAPDQHFAKRFWMPPQSTRKVIQPIRTPAMSAQAIAESEERSAGSRPLVSGGIRSVLVDPETDREYGRGDSSLIILDHEWRAGVLRDSDYGDLSAEMVRMSAHAGPDGAGGGRRMPMMVQEGREPEYFAGWDQYKVVTITRAQPHLNSAQIEAVRQYMLNGGVVWIALDRVDPAFCERLLGDSFTCRVVDRVQYNDLTFTDDRGSETSRSLEKPVDMVRIVAPGFNVEHTIDGWPASVWRDVGQGRLVVTTVGTRAWIEQPGDVASGHLLDVDRLVFLYESPETVTTARQQEMASSRIGYEIMGRNRVVGVLAVMIVAMLVTGLALGRMRRLEWQSLLSAVLAIAATFVLLGMGKSHLKQTPTTIAGMQWMRVEPAQDAATVSATRKVYAQDTATVPFIATRGGVGRTVRETTGRPRMVWSDVDRWIWEMPEVYAGSARSYESRNVISLDEPITATLRLGDEQLTGDIKPGILTGLGDPVIATRTGRMLPRLTEGGFAVDAHQRAPSEQFFTGSVSLTDQQARRLEVYRTLLNRQITKPTDYYPTRPTLLVWADTLDDGMRLELDAEHQESALVEIPLRLEPVEPGTQVHVPPVFIERFADRGPAGSIRVTPYDPRRNEWIGHRSSPMTFMFRFELPDVASHLEMTRGILRLHIDAPQRSVDLLDPTLTEDEVLDSRLGPQGTIEFDLAEWPVFQPDDNGHIRIRMRIGETEAPQGDAAAGQASYWGITGMGLAVDGVVLEPKTPSE